MTAETIVQSLLSGLLTGLIYALIAVGLSLIFGLMDVVNFAHGEFLMTAMYATLGFTLVLAIDPIIAGPLVAALLFVFGGLVYLGIIRLAMRARTNVGMVQIFSTFGLAILMRGLAQYCSPRTTAAFSMRGPAGTRSRSAMCMCRRPSSSARWCPWQRSWACSS